MNHRKSLAFSDSLLMKEARDLYFAATGFSLKDYSAPSFTISILGVPLKLPNTAGRKRDVPLHDLHHILTGFTNDWIGEAEIGAWELRAGCRSFAAYFLNLGGVAIGLALSPGRVWKAFRVAKGRRSLYRDSIPYSQLLEMTVGELRTRLGIRAST